MFRFFSFSFVIPSIYDQRTTRGSSCHPVSTEVLWSYPGTHQHNIMYTGFQSPMVSTYLTTRQEYNRNVYFSSDSEYDLVSLSVFPLLPAVLRKSRAKLVYGNVTINARWVYKVIGLQLAVCCGLDNDFVYYYSLHGHGDVHFDGCGTRV